MTQEKYRSYKESGVSWLGKIPEHWETRRIKYVFKELENRSEAGKEELLSVSQYSGITKKADKVAKGESVSNAKTLEGYKIVKKGDLVINIMLAWNGSLGISNYDGIVSPAYCVYRNLIGDERYFGYLFKTKNAQQEFKKQSTGIIDSRLRMYTDSFFNIKTAIPPIEEQAKIANYLDFKIEKISRFIKKKKQLIKLLNEQKVAIINQAVTKGLDPKVPMKDSGIEWLGGIPKHWEVKPLKHLLLPGQKGIKIGPFGSAIKSEIIKGIDEFEEGENFFKIYGQEHPIASDFKIGNKYITEKDFERLANYEIKPGDIVISMMGTIGRSNVVPENIEKGIMDSHLIRIGVNGEIYSDYLSRLINDSFAIMTNMLFESKGAIMNGLNSKIIKALLIPKPPLKEQVEIQEFIKNEVSAIHKTIQTIDKEITLVEEYKTALIAEAVTGKIDVRHFRGPLKSKLQPKGAEATVN